MAGLKQEALKKTELLQERLSEAAVAIAVRG